MKKVISLISVLAVLMVVLSGPLYKYEVLELSTAFATIKYGVFVGVAALILIVVQYIFMRKSVSLPVTGLSAIFAAIAVAIPLSLAGKAKDVPAIHDISTDVVTPPKFIAIAPLRADAPNPVEYAGDKTAAQQLKAYGELSTLKYSEKTKHVFRVAKDAVATLGWELVDANVSQGIIEATDTTAWFGFKDDVVIRIVSNAQGSKLDIRSKSRVGKSDLGKNAERIHAFIKEISKELTPI